VTMWGYIVSLQEARVLPLVESRAAEGHLDLVQDLCRAPPCMQTVHMSLLFPV